MAKLLQSGQVPAEFDLPFPDVARDQTFIKKSQADDLFRRIVTRFRSLSTTAAMCDPVCIAAPHIQDVQIALNGFAVTGDPHRKQISAAGAIGAMSATLSAIRTCSIELPALDAACGQSCFGCNINDCGKFKHCPIAIGAREVKGGLVRLIQVLTPIRNRHVAAGA